jgi:hypothetical protein
MLPHFSHHERAYSLNVNYLQQIIWWYVIMHVLICQIQRNDSAAQQDTTTPISFELWRHSTFSLALRSPRPSLTSVDIIGRELRHSILPAASHKAFRRVYQSNSVEFPWKFVNLLHILCSKYNNFFYKLNAAKSHEQWHCFQVPFCVFLQNLRKMNVWHGFSPRPPSSKSGTLFP